MPIGHILFVAPSAYPLGGIATWIDYVVPGLRKKGWDVTLGLTEGTLHDVNAYLAAHPMQGVVKIRNQTGTREGRVRALCRTIMAVKPDIVASANIVDVYSAVDRLKRSRSLRVRSVMTLHGLDVEYFEQIKGDAASLDGVIATNRLACKLTSTEAGLESCRVHYAPYGVHVPGSSLSKRNKKPSPIRIGFVGRLEKAQKRIDELVAIVRELDRQNVNYELIIAGAGPEEDWLRSELSSNVERGTVQFLGAVSGKELEELYETIHTLLITSYWETGPIVAWEAMARRVLVVTSAYIGMGLEGNLRHGENCLVYPFGNTAAAVNCITDAQNTELQNRLTSAAIVFVREKMTHDRSIKYWSECFANIKRQSIRMPSADEQCAPAGRLDRLFGRRWGEVIRRMPYRKQIPLEPGHEWPHISVISRIPRETFWELAKAADRRDANEPDN